ncbi:MAG TPA: hypothetical protein VH917_04860 [Ignavibacteriaceae bacterium]
MIAELKNIITNSQFQLMLAGIFVLFVIKLITGNPDTSGVILLTDIVLVITILFFSLTLISYIKKKQSGPMTLVVNVGIINALIFIIITLGNAILSIFFDDVTGLLTTGGLLASLISVSYVMLFAGFFVYMIIVLRHFYFLRQGNNLHIYFNSMLVIFFLASFTHHLFGSGNLAFISDTFFIVSIILLSFNSLKIPWIAFIVKREKIYLLILTVIISGLLIVNLVIGTESQLHSSLITSLTPMMSKFSQITLMYGAVYFSILFFTILFHIPTAEAFDRKAQEVSSLQYFSKLITRVLDFNELSETVTDITLKVGSADASWIIWKNMNEFESIAPKGAGYIDT